MNNRLPHPALDDLPAVLARLSAETREHLRAILCHELGNALGPLLLCVRRGEDPDVQRSAHEAVERITEVMRILKEAR